LAGTAGIILQVCTLLFVYASPTAHFIHPPWTSFFSLQAPTLYDDRIPIDKKFSDYATSTVVRYETSGL
jgi:hypothetical protein